MDGLGQNPTDGQVNLGASNSPFTTQGHTGPMLSWWCETFGFPSCQQMSDAQSIALAGLTATLLFATGGVLAAFLVGLRERL